MSYFFGFESDQERTLAFIPMLVRMKLDLSGVKISLAQWNRLPEQDRRRLLEYPCEGAEQAATYRDLITDILVTNTGERPRPLPPPADLPWNDLHEVPAQLVSRAIAHSLTPPSLEQWRALSAAQRYALLKVTREGHESPHFLPALYVFALV